jgi:hypothetical protein
MERRSPNGDKYSWPTQTRKLSAGALLAAHERTRLCRGQRPPIILRGDATRRGRIDPTRGAERRNDIHLSRYICLVRPAGNASTDTSWRELFGQFCHKSLAGKWATPADINSALLIATSWPFGAPEMHGISTIRIHLA